MDYYAGIGSRSTPEPVLDFMYSLATMLTSLYTLRSGGAEGADIAFQQGAGNNHEIFRANDATAHAMAYSSKLHPNWNRCSPFARKLHGRNAMIVLGKQLDKPVKFVMCYTTDGRLAGGTAQGIRIALYNNIPVYNLGTYIKNNQTLPSLNEFYDKALQHLERI